MHINFDDEGMIINNIQLFLKENINIGLNISGVWDIPTHEALIQFLKLPNTADVYEIKSKIISKFTYRESYMPFSLVDGGGIFNFDNDVTPTSILFYTKPTVASYNNGMLFMSEHLEELDAFVKSYGWSVTSHTSYGTGTSASGRIRAEIRIEKTGVKNYFPHNEVLPMVNLFSGKYLYNMCFATNNDAAIGHMQHNTNYKVAVIPCKPGDTFTITHGYSMSCEMAFAYTNRTIPELKQGNSVENIVSRLEGAIKGAVKPGDWDYYEIPLDEDARYLLVQMPYRDDLTSYQTDTITILLGDVNQDGVVDENDYNLLNQYVEALENNIAPPTELSDNAKIAANVNKNIDIEGHPIIDRNDVTILRKALDEGKVDTLGSVTYEKMSRVSAQELDRLLVMSGQLSFKDDLNIPIDQFWIKPWAVHSKFIEYFLGRVIHKYSDIEDICWLQENIRHMYAMYTTKKAGTYDDPATYSTEDNLVYDNVSGMWKYYSGSIYTGYIVVSDDKFETGKLVTESGQDSNFYIYKRRLYEGNKFQNKIILEDGTIVTENSAYSLKSLVKEFQLFTNKQLEAAGTASADRLKWTYGNYCVDTDVNFVRAISSNITYTVGAFK